MDRLLQLECTTHATVLSWARIGDGVLNGGNIQCPCKVVQCVCERGMWVIHAGISIDFIRCNKICML